MVMGAAVAVGAETTAGFGLVSQCVKKTWRDSTGMRPRFFQTRRSRHLRFQVLTPRTFSGVSASSGNTQHRRRQWHQLPLRRHRRLALDSRSAVASVRVSSSNNASNVLLLPTRTRSAPRNPQDSVARRLRVIRRVRAAFIAVRSSARPGDLIPWFFLVFF